MSETNIRPNSVSLGTALKSWTNVVAAYLSRNILPTDKLPEACGSVSNEIDKFIKSHQGKVVEKDFEKMFKEHLARSGSIYAVPNEGTPNGAPTYGEVRQPDPAQAEPVAAKVEPINGQQPAVDPKLSVQDFFIICLEDGKRFKSLKRHLRVAYNMSAEQYREKWNLPHDYPMVAPSYSEQRRILAKQMGLGVVLRQTPQGSGEQHQANEGGDAGPESEDTAQEAQPDVIHQEPPKATRRKAQSAQAAA